MTFLVVSKGVTISGKLTGFPPDKIDKLVLLLGFKQPCR